MSAVVPVLLRREPPAARWSWRRAPVPLPGLPGVHVIAAYTADELHALERLRHARPHVATSARFGYALVPDLVAPLAPGLLTRAPLVDAVTPVAQARRTAPDAPPADGPAPVLAQGYLAPPSAGGGGVNLLGLWDRLGAARARALGAGVRVGLLELGFEHDQYTVRHVDLPAPYPLLGAPDALGARHGLHTLGVLCAAHDGAGVDGFVPDATPVLRCPPALTIDALGYGDVGVVARLNAAILELSAALGPGDVLVLEVELETNGVVYPCEVQPLLRGAIDAATARGITVIAPTGNEAQALADLPGRLPGWDLVDPTAAPTSEAVLVSSAYVDRSPHKCGWGPRVDCFAWGGDVATLDVRDGYHEDYSGTSAATAILAGCAAVVQSLYRTRPGAAPGDVLDPTTLRAWLRDRARHTPARDDLGRAQPDHIGVMPDLLALAEARGLLDAPVRDDDDPTPSAGDQPPIPLQG